MVIHDFSKLEDINTEIYWEKHTPFTIAKEIEYKKDLNSYEILNFLTAVEEFYNKQKTKALSENSLVSDMFVIFI